jgi:serine/threonine-protein kinase
LEARMIERIGNCRIVEEIGSGGMAVIYKAVQESLGRTVAIKALKTAVAAESQFAIRFEREARSVATLQHENIIHIYDFHKESGNLFIVMEFVEGIDLYDLLDRCGAVPPDVAAIIAMQVARALDYAHYRGIIHRDIKPANIMISKQGGVKLMDFGIARDKSYGDLTETGTGLGTPSYMSPEQILGDKLDFRSDIFSLGIVLYQMATGRKPFIEDEHKSVMHKIRLERYPSPRKINPQIPRELERIMYRCMGKLPRDRYRSTQDLVLALERFISRRVDMNYHARLVLFLRNQGVLTEQEAEAYLHPAVVGYGGADNVVDPTLRRVLRANVLALGTATFLTLLIHVLPIGASASTAPPALASPAPAPPLGYLRVVANPWAEIWIDGQKVETTPLARRLPLPAGMHRVELKNPFYRPETRDITILRDDTTHLRIDLSRAPVSPAPEETP